VRPRRGGRGIYKVNREDKGYTKISRRRSGGAGGKGISAAQFHQPAGRWRNVAEGGDPFLGKGGR